MGFSPEQKLEYVLNKLESGIRTGRISNNEDDYSAKEKRLLNILYKRGRLFRSPTGRILIP